MKLDELLNRIDEYYNRDVIPPVHDNEADLDDIDPAVVATPEVESDEEDIDENVFARQMAHNIGSDIVKRKTANKPKPKKKPPVAKKKPAKKKGGFIGRLFGRK
jgi:hypothetical protein